MGRYVLYLKNSVNLENVVKMLYRYHVLTNLGATVECYIKEKVSGMYNQAFAGLPGNEHVTYEEFLPGGDYQDWDILEDDSIFESFKLSEVEVSNLEGDAIDYIGLLLTIRIYIDKSDELVVFKQFSELINVYGLSSSYFINILGLDENYQSHIDLIRLKYNTKVNLESNFSVGVIGEVSYKHSVLFANYITYLKSKHADLKYILLLVEDGGMNVLYLKSFKEDAFDLESLGEALDAVSISKEKLVLNKDVEIESVIYNYILNKLNT